MIQPKINWKKVWEDFEDYTYTLSKKPPTCKKCGQEELLYDPPWELQQKKIEELLYERGVTINWCNIWKTIDSWLEPFECECEKCHRSLKDYPEWPDQQDKIESLVNTQLKE